MYKYLSIESIIAIKEYKNYGFSIRKIAKIVDYSKSTVHRVCRLLNKNLLPLEILNQFQKNKQNAGRKLIILTLTEINSINHLLITKKYALDIIANFLKENKIKSISTKTLYNMFKTNRMGFDENNLLRKGKNKSHKQKETRGKINNCKSIHERNLIIPNIKNIQEFGHLEGDTIIGKDHKSSIITLADIWSKTTIPLVTQNHKSENITKSIIKFISKLQKGTVKTITFDRGKEFSKWRLIEKICNVKIYFADPGKPCQRGLNENNNGILRRYLPKSTDLSSYKQKDLNFIAFQINSTPRKSLSYKRPIDLIQLF
ncbi:IS30 family transposase [Spiroplasma endosymbiont of Zeiraphera isertana]|uniref:IS30 family transposase n=1 Tax=Spiroplasma endosymbiont of Zeiraphera isertana TaxID=3066313 RepID=UPI00313B90A6